MESRQGGAVHAWRELHRAAIPVAVAEGGNTTVYFQVLSYAGALTIAAITDPDHGPDLDGLMQRLGVELELIMASP